MAEFPLESARVIEYEKDLKRLSEAIDAHMSNARQRKWNRALQWFSNTAFLAGQHMDTFRYSHGTFTQSTVVIPPRLQQAVTLQMVDNHILRIVESNKAELTGSKPYPQVEPASISPDDEDLALIAQLAVKVLWEKPLCVSRKLRQLVGYLATTGTAALETYFGELDTVEQRMKMELRDVPDLVDPSGTVKDWVETGETEWVKKLGLRMKVWSGFHIDVNPDATDDPDTLTWICRSTFEDVTLVQEMFKGPGFVKGALKGLGPEECTDDPLWHWEQIKDLIDSPNSDLPVTVERGTKRSLANCVRVRMIDTRPNLDHPMGRHIIQVGGRVVYAGPSRTWTEAYPERWTPMRISRWWTLSGRFEGIPLISPLKPLQKRVNALHAIIRLSRQHLGIGAWLLPKVCQVPEGFIGPVTGQNVTYRSGPRGEKPERMEYIPLPADVWEELAGMIQSMERIGGIASAQLGGSTSPSALRAGVMLDFGQRMALQGKSVTLIDFEELVGDTAQDMLQEVARNMGDDPELLRRIAVAGRDLGGPALERFTTLDLRDNVRVQIDLRSEMLQTPEAKKEAAATFLQFSGQNMSPVERAKVAKIMGLSEIESQVSAQWKRARRMVERVLQGQVEVAVVLDGVDDPAIFGEVVRDAMLSERAAVAPMEVKQALTALMEAYSEQLQKRAQKMAKAIAEETQNSSGVASPAKPGQTAG